MNQGTPILTPERVRVLALAKRVYPDVEFHGHKHGVSLNTLRQALLFCFRVAPDRRRPEDTSYVALCSNWGGELYRVDFNLRGRSDGEIILVVTGWRMK